MTLSDGDRLGPWLIEGPLGSGAVSVVNRALDLRLDRRVALKVLVDELASSRSCGDKLLEAGSAGATLAHRRVVPIFKGGRQSDVVYVSSGLVEVPTSEHSSRAPVASRRRAPWSFWDRLPRHSMKHMRAT